MCEDGRCTKSGSSPILFVLHFYEFWMVMSQGLLGLCCLIETRDRIERITLTAVLFD